MLQHYILKDRKPVPTDMMTWARWLGSADRIVGKSEKDGVRVSTVFIGTHSDELFETMIFGGEHDSYQIRCDTWEQAEAQHKRACEIAGIPHR